MHMNLSDEMKVKFWVLADREGHEGPLREEAVSVASIRSACEGCIE